MTEPFGLNPMRKFWRPKLTYVAAAYRLRLDHGAPRRYGGTLSGERHFMCRRSDNPNLKAMLRTGSARVLYRSEDEETATRAMFSHWAGYRLNGPDGHAQLLKLLVPTGETELLVDVTPQQIREAVGLHGTGNSQLFDVLTDWVYDKLRTNTRADTLIVIAASLAGGLTSASSGAEAQDIVDRAVEVQLTVQGAMTQGYPALWAAKLARNKTGIQLSEPVVAELARRMKTGTAAVSCDA
ncbi:hypothetical protein [Mycobacteroides abscessus]|uniref:hypothetical protein n=1 Tax=Mycobacteroides abscessus TaxID=36809 RepID=UPI0010426993|nr:hypothetical protein [Mycobacteroides abscessus]